MASHRYPIRICLVATADAMASPASGIYETLQTFNAVVAVAPDKPSFQAKIVGLEQGLLTTPSGLPLYVEDSINDVAETDVVLVASLATNARKEWQLGQNPRIVEWMQKMHDRGALLCSACTGALLVAETGLLDGLEITTHWAYGRTFRHQFPAVNLNLKEALIAEGKHKEIITAGAGSAWQDLLLYLVARYGGADAARVIGNFMLFQWHRDGQASYIAFHPPTDHGDAVISQLQEWLIGYATIANPVGEMVKRSGLSETTFKRRFKQATGLAPIQYVQYLRIEDAKRRLESTATPIDEISWQVGYEDAAFFRRLFKRLTYMTPRDYRQNFCLPAFASIR